MVVALAARDTHALRHQVLRPHQTLADCAYPGDEVQGAHHAGVRLGMPEAPLVAIGSIAPEADPSGHAVLGDWRIRGMAVHPDHRGARHGRRVLDALVAHARDAGGAVPWCNARERALRFYERAGFRTYGERFDSAGSGPHFVMARVLPPRPKAPELRTARLRLVPLRAADAELTFHALSDPALYALLAESPRTRPAPEAVTRRPARGISPRDDPPWPNWPVPDREGPPTAARLPPTPPLTPPDRPQPPPRHPQPAAPPHPHPTPTQPHPPPTPPPPPPPPAARARTHDRRHPTDGTTPRSPSRSTITRL